MIPVEKFKKNLERFEKKFKIFVDNHATSQGELDHAVVLIKQYERNCRTVDHFKRFFGDGGTHKRTFDHVKDITLNVPLNAPDLSNSTELRMRR